MRTVVIQGLIVIQLVLISIFINPHLDGSVAEQQAVLFGNVSLLENFKLTVNTLDEAIVDLHSSYQTIHITCRNLSKKDIAHVDIQPFNHKLKISPGINQTQKYPVIFPSVLLIKNITYGAETKVFCEINAIQN